MKTRKKTKKKPMTPKLKPKRPVSVPEPAPVSIPDPASLWKCIQMPVLDMSGQGLLKSLRNYLLEDSAIYMVVFNLSTFPTSKKETEVKKWYRNNIGIWIEEIFAICYEAYIVLVATFYDKFKTPEECDECCKTVEAMAMAHCQGNVDSLKHQVETLESKPQMMLADQERLMVLREILDKQNIRLFPTITPFSSVTEGPFASEVLKNLIQLFRTANDEREQRIFKQALEPMTNLHSEIIDYIEQLATSMRFPIISIDTFEDIFFTEYQIVSEQIVKRIPKFLHQTGHIFWSQRNNLLGNLVCLQPDFICDFLHGLFYYTFDEQIVQNGMTSFQEMGRRLFQINPMEVRDLVLRFVRNGISTCQIGEILLRKSLNIKSTENLRASLVRNSSSISETTLASEDPESTQPIVGNRHGNKKESIASAPIHSCVETYCIGFQLAYAFTSDSLEYLTMFDSKLSLIDMKNPHKLLQNSTANKGVSSDETDNYYVKLPKQAKAFRNTLISTDSVVSTFTGKTGEKLNKRQASDLSTAGKDVRKFLLFPALRSDILPESYKMSITDAWDDLPNDLWVGASLTFSKRFYPAGAFQEILTRIRTQVQQLEFAFVWFTGAFGKFINSTSCFVKIVHKTTENGDNTISFEIRCDEDIPSPESAKLTMMASNMFTEKTQRDYIMNLWERLFEILNVVEEYCKGFAVLLLERRVRCPQCRQMAFVGEWTSPRELQAFPAKTCPSCGTSIATAYLVQPKSSQRELCERIKKNIQKKRASEAIAQIADKKESDSDSNSDSDTVVNINDDDEYDYGTSLPSSAGTRRSGLSSARSSKERAARLTAFQEEFESMVST